MHSKFALTLDKQTYRQTDQHTNTQKQTTKSERKEVQRKRVKYKNRKKMKFLTKWVIDEGRNSKLDIEMLKSECEKKSNRFYSKVTSSIEQVDF